MVLPTNSSRQLYFVLMAGASCLLIFFTTERCFYNADIRKAITMVQQLTPADSTLSIPQAIAKRYPKDQLRNITWSGNITNNCYGFVRVQARAHLDHQPTEIFTFDVNLVGQRLHPGNDNARQVMRSIPTAALNQVTRQADDPALLQNPSPTP